MGKVLQISYFENKKANKLLKEFEVCSKKDYYWLLGWIKRFQVYADNRAIKYDKNLILSELESVGYKVNSYCEEDYDETIEYIEAGYLVGQFMCYIKYDLYTTKSILHLINRFEDKYEKTV